MIAIDDEILADTGLSPGKVTLGERTSDAFEVTVRNNRTTSRNYGVTHQNSRVALGTYPPHGMANLPRP